MKLFSNKKLILLITYLTFILLLFPLFVQAAKISGSIYDLGLEKTSDVIVEINSTPKQFLISKDGDYSLNVGVGSYLIHAFTDTSESYETIIIADNGEYIIDLILTESVSGSYVFDDLDLGLDVSSDLPSNNYNSYTIYRLIFLIILVFILFTIWIIYLRKNSRTVLKEEIANSNIDVTPIISKAPGPELEKLDIYETKILSIVKKEKRTTQKDIRKEIPLSEAKISLVLADLESKGKIRKIKKGRGNIIIFEKD